MGDGLLALPRDLELRHRWLCALEVRDEVCQRRRSRATHFEKVVKAHFYLRRELVRAQLDGWEAEATQPSRISSMVREMKAELDKLDASCLR